MKSFNLLTSVFLMTSFLHAYSAKAEVINGEVNQLEFNRSVIQSINSVAKKSSEGWISYQVKMEPNNGMPCCSQNGTKNICELDKRSNSWSIHSGQVEDSKVLNIYFKWKNNQPTDMFYAGSECTVDAGGQSVLSLSTVTQKQSIDFLKHNLSLDYDDRRGTVSSKSLAGIALHHGELAHQTLEKIANRSEDDQSQDAIFWLGEARNKAGYKSLLAILDDKERALESREKAVFALSQNSYEGSINEIIQLAQHAKERDIQHKAIFWLADSKHPRAAEIISSILNSDSDHEVKEKAVFGLHQLNTDESWNVLINIAKGHQHQEVREKAIFWLSQDKSRDAKSVLLDLVLNTNTHSIKEKAVFALSQLSEPQATDALLEVLNSTGNRSIKKKALFWLGQSNDPRAFAALEEILTASID